MITAEIIKDSVNSRKNRLTSWVLTYPRFIHSELMTHRMFSRNAASSRAIPIKKMLAAVRDNPAKPEFWGANQKGMQAATEVSPEVRDECENVWIDARDKMIEAVEELERLGLHKQISNRLLEPWAHMTVILTASEFENFFALRAHPDAQPEFQKLAYLMLERYRQSVPKLLQPGEWHIPFDEKMPDVPFETKLKIAVARCARVSYLTFDGEINVKDDIELHDRLKLSGHWSPFEHVAYAAPGTPQVGNFIGWVQYRKQWAGENRRDFRVHEPPSPPPQQ